MGRMEYGKMRKMRKCRKGLLDEHDRYRNRTIINCVSISIVQDKPCYLRESCGAEWRLMTPGGAGGKGKICVDVIKRDGKGQKRGLGCEQFNPHLRRQRLIERD